MNKPKIHPVQTSTEAHRRATAPTCVTLKAYEVYKEVYGPQEAIITGNCRGGFGAGELIALLYARSFPKEEWGVRVKEATSGLNVD